MNIAIIDDDSRQLDFLKTALSAEISSRGLTGEIDGYSSGEEFFAAWRRGKYDLIVLDIYMGSLNGIDAARRLRANGDDAAVVFCTSSNDFAAQSYEVNAAYYINKPVTAEKLAAMLNRLRLSQLERSRAVSLPDGYRCPLRKIVYTEYINHSVYFHIEGQAPHSVYMSQADAEALLLAHKNFYSVNKGCIVNFSTVRRLSGGAFLMNNGETVPIARRRFKEVEEAYKQFHFEQLDKEVTD